MRIYFLFIFFLISKLLNAQNLVPNPSFEDTVLYSNGQPGVIIWQNNIGSPDYFTPYYLPPFDNKSTPVNNRGNQMAYDGVAYFGFAVFNGNSLNQREYLQIGLIDSLKKDLLYEVEFYLSLADTFQRAMESNNIGLVFLSSLDNGPTDHKVREFRPFYTSDTTWDATDKVGWQKFHYTYKAIGGEKVLAIGCFLKDTDVSIVQVGNGGSFPLAATGSYYYIDQISVQWKDTSTSIQENQFLQAAQLYPNPVKESFVLKFAQQGSVQFQLFDLKGETLHISSVTEGEVHRFSVGHLPKGLYFLQVRKVAAKRRFKLLKE